MDPTRLVRSFTASRPASPGTVARAGQAEPPNAARWSRYCGDGWVQWADLGLADAWFAEAARRTSAATEARLRGAGWDAQRDGTIAAWQALSAAFRALNLPPLSSPDYAAALQRYYANPRNRSSADAQAQVVRGLSARPDAGPLPGPVGADLARVYKTARGVNLGPSHYVQEIFVRLSLTNPEGLVQELCVTGAVGGGDDCDFAPGLARWNGCGTGARGLPDCVPYDWNTWAWHDPPAPLFAAGDRPQVERALPAMWWSFALARELGQAMQRRGAADVLRIGRLYQIAKNLRTAAQNDVDIRRLPGVQALVDANFDQVRTDIANRNAASVSTVGGAVVAALAAATAASGGAAAPVLAVGGLVVGVGVALARFLPPAYGYMTDEWGRAMPVFERAWIEGDATTPPAYAVAGPPGYVPPARPAASNCAAPGTTAGGIPPVAVAAGIGGLALLAWWLLA